MAALRHFQPHGVLISKGDQRIIRRAANEQALDTHEHLHHLADPMRHVLVQEAAELLSQVTHDGTLTWAHFERTWLRIVRRIVLGAAARDDHQLTELLDRLRRHANWAYLAPQRRLLRAGFKEKIRSYVDRAEPGGLAGTTFVTFTPFLHRGPRLSYADTFTPQLWLDGRVQDNPAFVPFSGGPAECPGRNLVLFVTSTMLSILLRAKTFTTPALGTPLPATLNPFAMRFASLRA